MGAFAVNQSQNEYIVRGGLWKKILQELVRPWFVPHFIRVSIHKLRGVHLEDPDSIYIGINVRLDAGSPELLHIGRNVHIEEGAKVLCHLPWPKSAAMKRAPTVIKDNVYIGLNAIVGPGVTVGQGSYIHANSLILDDIPPDSIIHGHHGSK